MMGWTKFYLTRLFLYNDYNNYFGGKYNNHDVNFLNNTTNLNVSHDAIDVVVEIEPYKNFPGSNSFLNEQAEFNADFDNVDNIIFSLKILKKIPKISKWSGPTYQWTGNLNIT